MAQLASVFVVEATYAPDAAERRKPHREEHLERIGKLDREGVVIVAGAFADLSASCLVLALESEEAAEAIVTTDVYWRNGVWTAYTIRQLNRLVF